MIKKLLFLFATVSCTSLTTNAQNLVLNGDLEAGSGDVFTNWSRANNPANNLAATTVPSEVHGGLRALKALSTGAAEYNVQFQSDAVTTVVGTSYEVTFWIKALTGGNTMRLSTVGGSSYYQPAQTIGTAWQQVTYSFVANTTSTKISFDLGKSTDTFYVDDIEMYTLSNNTIANGGFETAGASGNIFANWTATNGAAQMTVETTNIRTGNSALKAVSTGTQEYNVQMQSDNVATVIGRNYEIAIWVKSVGGASTIRLSTSGGTAVYGNNTVIGTTWQRLALAFKATATTTKLSMDLGKNTDTFYIDDAAFNSAQTTSLGNSDFEAKKDKVVFYPNPVENELNINSDASVKAIRITDITGKIIRIIQKTENIQSVDLSDLNKGLYILSTDTNEQFKFLKN